MNKGETHGTTNKYIWLIEILSQPKTFMQVQELWKKCSLNNNQGQPLDRKPSTTGGKPSLIITESKSKQRGLGQSQVIRSNQDRVETM